MIRTCKNCGGEFSDKHPKHIGRRIGLCGDCDSKDETVKTVGFTASLGKTNYWTEIVKSPSKALASSIRKQARCGPSHCHTSLGLDSSGATTAKKSLDSVITNLYNLEGSKAEENGAAEIEPLEERRGSDKLEKDKPNYSKCEDCGGVFDPDDEEGINNHRCPKEGL